MSLEQKMHLKLLNRLPFQ